MDSHTLPISHSLDARILKNLLNHAQEASKRSYSPYSHFRVGAAILGKSGVIYQGCNVENASYPVCICAERVACSSAIANGELEFVACAVAAYFEQEEDLKQAQKVLPCGVCRQFLSEFAPNILFITMSKENQDGYKTFLLSELLPEPFTPKDLIQK